MRPLPRLHAFTDGAILARTDLGVRAAAIAAAGASVALYARDRAASGALLLAAALRLGALARPPEAALLVAGRADVAAAVGAHGVYLGAGDLSPHEVRATLPAGWIGCSVHTVDAARAARDDGADYLVAGNIYRTASHPERAARGLRFITEVAALGLPVIAIGGITAARAAETRGAGAWGVAAIGALWDTDDAAAAALALLAPWSTDA